MEDDDDESMEAYERYNRSQVMMDQQDEDEVEEYSDDEDWDEDAALKAHSSACPSFRRLIKQNIDDFRQTLFEIKHAKGSYGNKEKLKELDLDFSEWLVILHIPKARQSLIDTIREHQQDTLETLVIRLVDSSFGFGEQVSTDQQIADCFVEIGNTLGSFAKLKNMRIRLATEHFDMTHPLSLLVDRLQQIESVSLSVQPQEDDHCVPTRVWESLRRLPNLKDFNMHPNDPFSFQQGCRYLQQSCSLTRLIIDGSAASDRLGLEEAHLTEFDALLRSRRWQRVRLQCIQLSEAGAAQRVLQSFMASPGLEELCLHALDIPNGAKDFYVQLGNALPQVTGVESFGCYIATGSMSTADHDECVSAILRGAALALSLTNLCTPPCEWSSSLVASLIECLSTTQSMNKLVIYGTVELNQSCAFGTLSLALSSCPLSVLEVWLNGDVEAVFDNIVTGVSASKTIKELTLAGSEVKFATASRLCCDILSNDTLKSLTVQTQDNMWDAELDEEMESSPEAIQRLCKAILENVELESLTLSPYTDYCESLKSLVNAVMRLNKAGRRYMKGVDKPEFGALACQMLETVNDSLDCLFVHLHDIPMLFRRA